MQWSCAWFYFLTLFGLLSQRQLFHRNFMKHNKTLTLTCTPMFTHALFQDIRTIIAYTSPRIEGCCCRISTAQKTYQPSGTRAYILRYAYYIRIRTSLLQSLTTEQALHQISFMTMFVPIFNFRGDPMKGTCTLISPPPTPLRLLIRKLYTN